MVIEILETEKLRSWGERLHIPIDAVGKLIQVAEGILNDPQLLNIFTEFHVKTAFHAEWMREWKDLPFDPLVEERLGKDTSLFYLLAYMAALPYAEQEYQRRGISNEIFNATMQDIRIKLCDTSDLAGYWRFSHFPWIWHHLAGDIFWLGRLQYILKPYDGHARAFRHRRTGQIRLLCGSGIDLRADGYALGAGGEQIGETPWRAAYEESLQGWRGHLVDPRGYALRSETFLSRAEWELALQAEDLILDIHIPRGKDLTIQDCRDSLQQAVDFFQQQAPDRPAKAFFCHTWMLSPQLQEFLPQTSRIVQFQREFYKYPHPGGLHFLWEFVFGERYPDVNTAPRDTSLRRAVLDWLAEGKEIFDLPGLIFHEPQEWGTQPYAHQWNQASDE